MWGKKRPEKFLFLPGCLLPFGAPESITVRILHVTGRPEYYRNRPAAYVIRQLTLSFPELFPELLLQTPSLKDRNDALPGGCSKAEGRGHGKDKGVSEVGRDAPLGGGSKAEGKGPGKDKGVSEVGKDALPGPNYF